MTPLAYRFRYKIIYNALMGHLYNKYVLFLFFLHFLKKPVYFYWNKILNAGLLIIKIIIIHFI